MVGSQPTAPRRRGRPPQPPPPPTPTAPHGRRKPRPQSEAIRQSNRSMQERVDVALRQLERALGGRAAIATALHCAEDLTEEENRIANLLTDPTLVRRPLREVILAADPKMTMGRLLKVFAKGKGAEAYARSLAKVYDGLPKTAEYLMETSVPHQGTCGACAGRGKVEDGALVTCEPCPGPLCPRCRGTKQFRHEFPCRVCSATGMVTRAPETERMKLAFQVGGILKDGGVRINNTQVNASLDATFIATSAAFRSATDKLLWQGSSPALQSGEAEEAELVKVEQPT